MTKGRESFPRFVGTGEGRGHDAVLLDQPPPVGGTDVSVWRPGDVESNGRRSRTVRLAAAAHARPVGMWPHNRYGDTPGRSADLSGEAVKFSPRNLGPVAFHQGGKRGPQFLHALSWRENTELGSHVLGRVTLEDPRDEKPFSPSR